MASFNKVILMGNLTRDPELRYTPKGTAVARLGLAVNRRWTSETGEQKEETTFVDVEAWGPQAENISKYMKKGSPLLVEGRLRMDQWDDKQTGQKRTKLVVVCENSRFIGSAAQRENNIAEPPRGQGAPPGQAPEIEETEVPPPDDDVPF